MRKKNSEFKNKFKKYISEDNYGDIFTSMNVLGDFFTLFF